MPPRVQVLGTPSPAKALLIAAAIGCVLSTARADANEPPAGLSRDDWRGLQRTIQESRRTSRHVRGGLNPSLVHEAELLGHGDAVGQADAAFGLSVSVSGDTVVVGAPDDDTPAGVDTGSASVFVRSGTTWTEQQKLLAPDAAAGDVFGSSVSIDGDTIVVGSYAGDTPGGVNAGAAYVFVRSGTAWSAQQKLTASDGAGGASFGYSVSVDQDTLVVGSVTDDAPGGTASGSAYVFVRSGTAWTEQQKLTASDGAANDLFGVSVSVSGDTAVVGAYADDDAGQNAGSAYVLVRSGTTWTEQQKLLAADGNSFDFFGYSVSVSGDTVVAGAYRSSPGGGVGSGSAYVFVRSGTNWTEQQKLVASDPAVNNFFGYSVSVSGDTVAVGAYLNDNAGGVDAGAAYVFVRSGTIWTEQQQVLAAGGAASDWFGSSVSVDGDTLAAGAQLADDAGGVDAGAAYVFARSGTAWTEQDRLVGSDTATGADAFGDSVSVSGDTVVVGAPDDDTPDGVDAGSAYVFVRSGTTWSEQQKLLAPDAAAGDLFGSSVSIDGDTLVVGAYAADTAGGVNAGAAYVFVRSGSVWTGQQKLTASDGAGSASFGYSVSVDQDTLVVGSLTDDTPAGALAGSAYVFVRSGTVWTEQQKLTAPDGAASDLFGIAVSLSGDTVAIGAYGGDTAGGANAGAAYVFVRSGTVWTDQQKLVASDGAAGDLLGASLALAGDTVAIGAYAGDTPGGVDAGTAYVFVRSGTAWAEQQKLMASDGAPGDLFGSSVGVYGDILVVGAPFHDTTGGVDAGSAYAFVRSGTTWTEQRVILAPDGAANDQSGYAVSVSGDTAIVGAPGDDTAGGVDAGSAHVWGEVQADLSAAKTDGLTTAVPGQPVTYTIAIGNAGPSAVTGATVTDTLPAILQGATWTCSASPGSSCSPGGSGSINDSVALLVAGTATYTLTGTVDAAATGTLVNSASVTAPGGVIDPNPGDNSATDTDILTPQADLSAAKTDGQTTAVPGQPVTYTITIANAGPSPVTGATVTDALPAILQGATWTCMASHGSSCSPGGSGSINDSVALLVAGTATYTLTGTVDAAATGTLVNTASVAAPGGVIDPNPGDNAATDTDTLTPQADLSAAKTDGQTTAVPGQPVTYTITIANAGPGAVTGATVTDALPAILQGATWTCMASPGSSCSPGGSGSINDSVALLVAGTATYTLTGTVDAAATGTLVNTASVAAPGSVIDPNPGDNSATDTDSLLAELSIAGELAHGCQRQYDLAALPGPLADQDLFRILQRAHASYEVLLDGASGDIGSGAGPFLERLASDASAVIQTSSAAGAGGSRTLRWMNVLDMPVADELVRVRSAGCTTSCDAADVYRLSALETTGFIPRFNNSGTQVTVLVLQNSGAEAIDVDIRFWSTAGASLGGPPFVTLGPRQTYVLNTSTIAPGSGGSISVANTGRYGQISGKAVAVEPATGFTFDTGLALRPR